MNLILAEWMNCNTFPRFVRRLLRLDWDRVTDLHGPPDSALSYLQDSVKGNTHQDAAGVSLDSQPGAWTRVSMCSSDFNVL